MAGALTGIRVLEFAGLGPAPFASMLLADLGADVVRIDRPNSHAESALARGKRSIALDLKRESDREIARQLCKTADILIEGFRPGVMESLGFAPQQLLTTNPRLVYGRMTGWGQSGPLAQAAGHDLNYIALTGALHAIGEPDSPPPPPLNLIGDFGGGSLYLVMGILAAVIHARATGEGQVVDAAMVDGTISLSGLFHDLIAQRRWQDERGANFLDGAAPYYRCYACADGKYVSVAAIEPQFWAELCTKIGLTSELVAKQNVTEEWPQLTKKLQSIFVTRTRDEWCELLEGSDACFAPVLSFTEAANHHHIRARQALLETNTGYQAAPAPRFSATTVPALRPAPGVDADRNTIMRDWL